jgi:hypothetical protein
MEDRIMIGIIFGILLQLLGVRMICKGKIIDNDSDINKKDKGISRRLGIFYIISGTLADLIGIYAIII